MAWGSGWAAEKAALQSHGMVVGAQEGVAAWAMEDRKAAGRGAVGEAAAVEGLGDPSTVVVG